MMIDPKTYSESIRNESLTELKKERNRLIEEIREYDNAMYDNNIVMISNPDPETIYLNNHLYLAEVCRLIGERLSHGDLNYEF
ncbi:MAG: hypothetical protein IJI80_06170 [Methanobrevibacter sp.]|uniref:hypothetical protein n=1 Tax=Methanobrevibacter sp. TaxID=66852 RepID=UPI0025D4A758|nr:hypothetical protein [Methanobrevibacter sp.]MBQ6139245.1 hypothetical protein [Methanobrevibacter sp.]